MIYIRLSLVALIVFFFSCKENKESGPIPRTEKNISQNQEKKQQEITTVLKVDIKNIKEQVDNVTTSFLPKDDTIIFIKKPKNNFFGVYYLIKGDPSNIVGKMIVYDDKNPYQYDKDTDEFVEINLWRKGIKLLDGSIEVGISKEFLIETLGDSFKIEGNILIYENSAMKAFFKINDNLIMNIKIGFYRDDISNSDILKYEW